LLPENPSTGSLPSDAGIALNMLLVTGPVERADNGEMSMGSFPLPGIYKKIVKYVNTDS
jgi:hypothetical protein